MKAIKTKKSILIICPYPEGLAASQRLKYEQHFFKWREEGYEITVSPFFTLDTWKILYEDGFLIKKVLGTLFGYLRRLLDLFRLRKFDHVYVCMWVTPLVDTFFERLYLLISNTLIFDFDDAIHAEVDPNPSSLLKKLFKGGRRKTQLLIKSANFVITSSPFNLYYCKTNNRYGLSEYIPCSLDTDRFFPSDHMKAGQPTTLGWTGTFTSASYLDSIQKPLLEACLKFNLKLILITNFDYKIPGIDVEVIRWKKETEIEDLHKIDIGLYPLIPSQWALGKGGLKVLQYMSLGLPSISSDFGTAQHIVEDGVNGYLVNNHSAWVDRIGQLAVDPELRRKIGSNARDLINKKYSTNAISSMYLDALKRSKK